jgi:D-3-phosphoglycerate dehydrogenase
MRVVITDGNFPAFEREIAAARAAGASIELHQSRTAQEVATAVAGADVAVVQFAPFHEEAVRALAPGATVIRYGVGYDNINIAAARQLGVKVAYIPDYCTDEVADHTAAMLLAMLRCLHTGDRTIRDHVWSVAAACPNLKPFPETVVGFLGLGRIGTGVLERLRPFGFRFIAFDPARDASAGNDTNVEFVDRSALFRRADALSLHAPSNPETRHIINAAAIAAMQTTAVIVNTARGDLIDTKALAAALTEGRLGGASLDVFETEPLPDNDPLRAAPNLILTPHSAWYSQGAIARLQTLAADEIARALSGRPPRRAVPG